MLHFSMYQSGIDFKCPYSSRPLKPLRGLIGLTQSLFSGHRFAKSPYLFNGYTSSAIDLQVGVGGAARTLLICRACVCVADPRD
jgi:hypothetical protein